MESSSRWRQERRTASDGDLVEVSGAGGERGDAVVDDEAVPERSMNVGSATLFARRSHLRARREMAGKPRARPSPARIPGSTAWNRTSQSTGVAVPWSCSVVPINRRGLMKGRTQLVIPVECSQAMLASLLRARPLCGERLREARATAEHALADAKAEGDDLAAVDVNLVLTFLAARDGDLDDALRRYKAAVQKDPSDSRPYELVVAAALGSGTLTTLGLERGGRGRLVLVAPWREVDARLTAAVLDDDLDLTLPERVQLRLLHHRRPDGLWRSSTGVG
ncbi:hypothetical protein OsJ_28584 [Oryza sativa Japonica Group]|uniref:Tetratricopeptide repeat protein n=1 Tax=Oryza sativa subsp. japonica TaxID=39947 RepID=B9G2F6_ORYSJ|nr:hypothetical protein OsJ_28584 [Oryza sativa Japonica Group]